MRHTRHKTPITYVLEGSDVKAERNHSQFNSSKVFVRNA